MKNLLPKVIDKVKLLEKLKTSVFQKNYSLGSIDYLPVTIKKNLETFLKTAIILYKQQPLKYKEIKPKSSQSFIIFLSETQVLEKNRVLLIIIPYENKRYIFQTLIKEVYEESIEVDILPPRFEERIKISGSPVAFLSIIPQNFLLNFLQKECYLIRETNFSMKNLKEESQLRELYFFDLVIDQNNTVDETFKGLINKHNLAGNLEDISNGGVCVKTPGALILSEELENGLIYLKTEISLKDTSIKIGVLTDLRNLRNEGLITYFHLRFLISFKPEIWEYLKNLFNLLRS